MFAFRFFAVPVTIASLCACGSSMPATTATDPVAAQAQKSWVRVAAQRETLLYVSEFGSSGVTIYANPGGDTFTLAGELFGFQSPIGLCADPRGDVFIADSNARTIVEYAHGAVTPKAVIADPLGEPYSCAIDRKTGRLAVTNLSNSSGGEPGNVLVFASPTSTPVEYSDSRLNEPLFCTFDRKGNVFVDAYDTSFRAVLGELPNGGSGFTILSLTGGTMNVPSGLLANGSSLLLGDSYDPKTKIYEITVSGSTATVANTIALSKTQTLAQFGLFGSGSSMAIIAPDYDYSNVWVYAYPSGTVLGSIAGGISQPVGAVISQHSPAR